VRNPREASAIAVSRRRERAAVKGAIRSGERNALDVAEAAWRNPSGTEGGLRVVEFLMSLRGIGETKLPSILDETGISERKRMGFLGVRQQRTLRLWLESYENRRATKPPRGQLVVLAGPTAVGKGTVVARIREIFPAALFSVSATTRAPRPGEIDGVHYRFVSNEQFDDLVRTGAMLEWATVHGDHRYGTPRTPIEAALAAGDSVILEIDIQGARQVKQSIPEALLVFLLPPSWNELVRRLAARGTESAAEQSRRLETAAEELAAQDEFDITIVNDDVDRAAKAVVELLIRT
jgi:guanylate kinase